MSKAQRHRSLRSYYSAAYSLCLVASCSSLVKKCDALLAKNPPASRCNRPPHELSSIQTPVTTTTTIIFGSTQQEQGSIKKKSVYELLDEFALAQKETKKDPPGNKKSNITLNTTISITAPPPVVNDDEEDVKKDSPKEEAKDKATNTNNKLPDTTIQNKSNNPATNNNNVPKEMPKETIQAAVVKPNVTTILNGTDFESSPSQGEDDALPDDVPKDVPRTKIQETLNKEKTLYEILGAPPTATRQELKAQYVKLAKLSHPDAQISNKFNNNGNKVVEEIPDFGEVAAAWRILGDNKSRKRYDVQLAAKAWSESAQRFTNERLEQAVPAVAAMMDKVAIPFLRRTTATTVAVGQTIANGFRSNNNNGNSKKENSNSKSFTNAVANVFEAGQKAGKAIDSIELNEKSVEIEERLKQQQLKADEIDKELKSVTEQRLFATLQSAEFALSSEEAKQVMDRLYVDDTLTLMDRAMFRNTIEKEISSLREAEAQFSEKLELYENTDQEWNTAMKKHEESKQDLTLRKRQEIEARKALENARRLVSEAKAELVKTSNALTAVELQVRKNASEMDRVTTALSKKQERVRNALKRKVDSLNGGINVDYMSEEELASLRRKEIKLMGESKEIATMVGKLSARAEKLKNRAEALEKWQKTGSAA